MPDTPLRNKSLEEVLDNVQMVSAVGDAPQIRSVMAVLAKCTIELGDALSTATREIRDFNQSTSELTTQIIALNKRLVLATIVIALATAVAAGVAVLTAL